MKIQLCIVSHQLPANLIPVLHDRPDRIVLVATPTMLEKGDQLEGLLRSLGGYSPDKITRFNDLPESPYSAIEDRALEIQDELTSQFPEAHWVLNATGGNKAMSLAFVEVFRDPRTTEIIYTDTANNQLDTISPSGTAARPLESVLTIDGYLKANRKTVRSAASGEELRTARERQSLTHWLARQAGNKEMQQFITVMNTLVGKASGGKSKLVDPRQKLNRPPLGNWKTALKKMADVGLIDWNENDASIFYFYSENSLTYLSGGWLEEYAWLVCADLNPNEIKMNVTFTDDYDSKANLRNEMDVIIQHQNRLMMIECKTGKFGFNQQKDRNILYKLDSISESAGGDFCSKMLLSAQELDHQTAEGRKVAITQDAKSRDIHVCQLDQLGRLSDQIKQWMDTGRIVEGTA